MTRGSSLFKRDAVSPVEMRPLFRISSLACLRVFHSSERHTRFDVLIISSSDHQTRSNTMHDGRSCLKPETLSQALLMIRCDIWKRTPTTDAVRVWSRLHVVIKEAGAMDRKRNRREKPRGGRGEGRGCCDGVLPNRVIPQSYACELRKSTDTLPSRPRPLSLSLSLSLSRGSK